MLAAQAGGDAARTSLAHGNVIQHDGACFRVSGDGVRSAEPSRAGVTAVEYDAGGVHRRDA